MESTTLVQMEEEMSSVNPTDVVDWWINKVGTYGLSFVFVACVLLLLLWVAISVIGIIKKHVPAWFESSMESHRRVAEAIEKLCETSDCVHDTTHRTHEGIKHAVRGVSSFATRNKSKFNIGSDVIIHFENSEEALTGTRTHVHRPKEGDTENEHGTGERTHPSP